MAFLNYKWANNATVQIASWISASSLSIILESWHGDLFPTEFPNKAKIEQFDTQGRVIKREIAKITWRSGDILTVVRAVEACPSSYTATTQTATAFSFNAGDFISIVISQDTIDDIQDEVVRLESDKLDTSVYDSEKIAYASTSTWSDSYEITVPSVISYISWQTFKVNADVPNNWTATLNVNWLWAKTLKKLSGWAFSVLATWDIIAGQIFWATYNGTDFQFSVDPASVTIPKSIWWNWIDGALTISSWTTTLTMTDNYIIKNYSSITISGTAILDIVWATVWTPWWVAYIKCLWNFTMSGWTIQMNWQGGQGWNTVNLAWKKWRYLYFDIFADANSWAWWASNSTTNGWGGWAGSLWIWTIPTINIWNKYYIGGGAGGWAGWNGGWAGATFGAGWNGWGLLVIEVLWDINFSAWTIKANWTNGSNWWNWTGGGWAGAGGGWAGGWVAIIYWWSAISTAWTIQVNWWNWWTGWNGAWVSGGGGAGGGGAYWVNSGAGGQWHAFNQSAAWASNWTAWTASTKWTWWTGGGYGSGAGAGGWGGGWAGWHYILTSV